MSSWLSSSHSAGTPPGSPPFSAAGSSSSSWSRWCKAKWTIILRGQKSLHGRVAFKFLQSCGSGSRVLMTQNWRKKIQFDQKLQFTYIQATVEAFSPQNRTSSTSKNKIYKLFSMFMGHFCPPGSDLDRDCESGFGSRDPRESGSTALNFIHKFPLSNSFLFYLCFTFFFIIFYFPPHYVIANTLISGLKDLIIFCVFSV